MGHIASNVKCWMVYFPEEAILEAGQRAEQLKALARIAGILHQNLDFSYPYERNLLAIEVMWKQLGPNNKVGELLAWLRIEKVLKELMEPYGTIVRELEFKSAFPQ